MQIFQKLYCVFDSLSGEMREFTMATSDGLAVRRILSTLRVPLKDTQCLCLGEYKKTLSDNESRFSLLDVAWTFYNSPKSVPWTSYKFPESPAEALAPLGATPEEIEQAIKNRK